MDNVDYALAYANHGFAVIPCHTPLPDGCSCMRECSVIGKHPRTAHGVKDATTDKGKIEYWFGMWPDANVAIATGQISGLVVIDIDEHKSGPRTYDNLPRTMEVETGQGRHFYFRYKEGIKNSVGALGPGIDIRSSGGYVIAPPSLHFLGKRYKWKPIKVLADFPDWIAKKLQDKPRSEYPKGIVPHDIRNDMLYRMASAMRRVNFCQRAIRAALLVTNERCQPPLSESEIGKIAWSAAKHKPHREEV